MLFFGENSMSIQAPGKKVRLAITRYFHSVLLLSGMLILLFLILDHFLHGGTTLSHFEKYLYIVLIAGAILLFLGGFWTGTTKGRQWFARLARVTENEIIVADQDRYIRIIGWLIFLTAYAIVFVAYLDIKYSVIHLDAARYFNDTLGYIQSGSYGITDIRFWSARRAFTVPLFYSISGYTLSNYSQQDVMERISRYQSFFSIFSWGILAISFSLGMKRRFSKIIAFAIILLLGASLYVTQWDRSMLAESISTSSMVLLMGFLIMGEVLWDRRQPIPIWIMVLLLTFTLLSAIFFTFARDTNAYLLLAFSGLMFIGLFFSSTRTHPLFRAYLIIMAGFLVIFSLHNLTVNKSRYVQSIFDVVLYRMIPNQESLNYLIAHGMPYDESYMFMTSLNLKQLDDLKMSNEKLQNLYTWVSDHGVNVLASYLLSHPLYTLSAPFKDIQGWANSENSGYRMVLVPISSRIRLLSTLMYLRWDWSPVLFLALFFASVGMIGYGRQRESLWVFVFSLFISVYPMALLIWHGDPGELQRHIFQVALQLRLAAWMLIVMMFERGLIRVQERNKTNKQLV